MSIGILASSDLAQYAERTELRPQIAASPIQGWDSNTFAREQIQGLVRQVFFAAGQSPVRQVVLSATERETDVHNISAQVAEVLAQETSAKVVLTGGSENLKGLDFAPDSQIHNKSGPLQRLAIRLSTNVWRLPSLCAAEGTIASLHSYQAALRREFDYSILELPTMGDSHQAVAIGEFADGIILVVSAQHTRRATARKVVESLASTRAKILGTVLSDRVFPIPEAIYRRL